MQEVTQEIRPMTASEKAEKDVREAIGLATTRSRTSPGKAPDPQVVANVALGILQDKLREMHAKLSSSNAKLDEVNATVRALHRLHGSTESALYSRVRDSGIIIAESLGKFRATNWDDAETAIFEGSEAEAIGWVLDNE